MSRSKMLSLSTYVALAAACLVAPSRAQCSCEWIEDQKLLASPPSAHASLGVSASIDGDWMVLGAPGDGGVGKAHVFTFGGATWVHSTTLDPGGSTDLHFAHSVSIKGDLIVVGAPYANNHAGKAYVYRFDGFNWNFEAILTSSTPADNEEFGWSVSVDGNVIAVGARFEDAAYTFRFIGGNWVEEQVLTGDAGDTFGLSVSLSGNTLLVGAPENDDSGANAGAIYIYRFDGSIWVPDPGKVFASDAAAGAHFGHSVSVHGDLAVVGAYEPGIGPGAAYVLRFDCSEWTEEKFRASDGAVGDVFGWSVAAGDDVVIVGAHGALNHHGTAYGYRWNGSQWTEHRMRASNGAFQDWLGYSVAVSDETIVAGADGDDEQSMTDAGSAYVFHVSDTTWATYGEGLPGTNGVPMLAPQNCPVIGQSFSLDISNSLSSETTGFLMLGYSDACTETGLGGKLLVLVQSVTAIPLPDSGVTLTATIPNDPALEGLHIYLQILVQDVGAFAGVSFSPGLDLTFEY